MKRVKITKLPTMKQGGGSYGPQTPPKDNTSSPGPGSYHGGNTPEIKVKNVLQPTDRENANLEAEKGETVITNLQGEGIPEFYVIDGKPHSRGGSPLNLPPNSFIFSVDRKLAIKDKDVLQMFSKPAKGSYTPAELSKTFDLNKYRQILLDPTADKIQIETAELMIKNYMLKLGALALAQESLKGFPDGIPAIAQAYMEKANISPEELLPQPEEDMVEEMPPPAAITEGSEEQKALARYGGTQGLRKVRVSLPKFNKAGEVVGSYAQVLQEEGPRQGENESDWMARTYGNPGFVRSTRVWDGTGWVDEGNNTNSNVMGAGMPQPPMPQLRRGERMVQDPRSGMFLIIDRRGNIKSMFDGKQLQPTPPDGSTQTEETNTSVTKSTKSTKRQNVPKDAVLHDPSKDGYDPKSVRAGHYIKENGRWYKVTKAKEKPYDGTPVDQLDERLQGKFGDLRKSYGRLEHAINNNPDLQDKLYKKYLENVGKKKASGVLKTSDITAAKNMSKEEVVKNYLDAQKQIMIINAQKGNIGAADKDDSWDTGWDSKTRVPKEYQKVANELGLDAFDPSHTFAFQAAYIGMQDLKDDPEFKEYLEDYAIGDKTQLGLDDEGAGAQNRLTISGADGWWGNTTTGEAQLYMPEVNEWEKEEVEDEEEKIVEEKQVEHLGPEAPPDPAKWWTQDIVNIAGDAYELGKLKKYTPWQATPQFQEATPEFVDFRGTAARIGSAAAAGAKEMATFAGPQAQAANFANIQRGTTDAILRAQEAEDKTNVGIANQFELANTQARNQYNMYKAGLDTQLWDKNVIANQQFDNAKRALREKLRFDFNQGWTNKGMTQTMNALRDDFAVDPTTGYIHKKPGYNPLEPSTAQGDQLYKTFQTVKTENPGMDDKVAMDLAKGMSGMPTGDLPNQVNAQQFMYPGGARMS